MPLLIPLRSCFRLLDKPGQQQCLRENLPANADITAGISPPSRRFAGDPADAG
jgi:hypothetical protein